MMTLGRENAMCPHKPSNDGFPRLVRPAGGPGDVGGAPPDDRRRKILACALRDIAPRYSQAEHRKAADAIVDAIDQLA